MQVRELKEKNNRKRRVRRVSGSRRGFIIERPKFNVEKFRLYAFILSCIIFAIASVGQYCKVITTNIEVVTAEGQVAELKREQQELKMNIAQLKSLVRIENIARNELAMEEAEELRIFTASRE